MKTDVDHQLVIDEIRNQFPIINQKIYNKPLVYFDNGATTQKPLRVTNAISTYYNNYNSNIHRGVHRLSQLATEAYDHARKNISEFLGAASPNEIVFVKGATDAINLVAGTWGKVSIKEGDEIIVSFMEHHSNIIPWQVLCEDKKAKLRVIPINERGELLLDEFEKLLSSKTKLVAVAHVSNTLGTINPVKEIIEKAKTVGALTLIDGCQAVQHIAVNVKELDCDFYCFSGHKVYAPTGIGVLYAKESILNEIPPYQTGGGMIQNVTFEKTTYACLPHKFEAGTPNIEGAIGLSEAIDFVKEIGIETIHAHENELLHYATEKIKNIPSVRIIGEAKEKASVISIVANGIHPYDLGTLLDKQGVAVRTGNHCTQPLMDHYGIPGTVRLAFAIYNTKEEVDIFIAALEKAMQMLS